MFRRLSIVLSVLFSLPLAAAANRTVPRIAAMAMESTASADLLRLVAAQPIESFEHKIICGEDSIRVRLFGLVSRRSDVEDIAQPKGGLFSKVRLIPRDRESAVIQLFPKRHVLATCSRMTLVNLEGEIVISTTLTPSDKSERKQANEAPSSSATDQAQIALLSSTAKNSRNEAPSASAKDEQGEEVAVKSISSAPLLSQKIFSQATTQVQGAKNSPSLGVTQAAVDANSLRWLAGFGLAAIAAGVALYLKRRRGGLAQHKDTIEILSAKKLGAHQQLILAAVEDTKFLLAVSDKTVSALGVVPGAITEGSPAHAVLNAAREAAIGDEEDLAQLIKETQAKAHPREEVVVKDAHSRFRREFGTALNAAMSSDDLSAYTEEKLSNAAGLIALARMRAEMNKNKHTTPTAEA